MSSQRCLRISWLAAKTQILIRNFWAFSANFINFITPAD
jgi:hypothetical protein